MLWNSKLRFAYFCKLDNCCCFCNHFAALPIWKLHRTIRSMKLALLYRSLAFGFILVFMRSQCSNGHWADFVYTWCEIAREGLNYAEIVLFHSYLIMRWYKRMIWRYTINWLMRLRKYCIDVKLCLPAEIEWPDRGSMRCM